MKRAFIFDMDGVIIDSEPIHFDVDIRTMSYLGANITQKQLERFVGMTNPEMWAIIKEEYSLAQSVEEIIDYQLPTKLSHLRELDIEPIEGIRELIADLSNHKIPMAIASSSPRLFINEVLKKFQIESYFEYVVSGEEVAQGKPAPDVYLEAARLLGVRPCDCTVLEDSKNGITSAKLAGMKCIGYVNENSGNQDLSAADYIVISIKEIKVHELYDIGDDNHGKIAID
jgi:HAD superfamily hydrolase (TIGR01509 family)